MEENKKSPLDAYELVVIGGGPGGYVAAIKAAQLGMRTALVEYRELGGTCLNRGCIPTKTLLHSALLYEEVQRLSEFGITIEEARLDPDKLWERKDSVVERMRKGIAALLEANHVTILQGKAKIAGRDGISGDFRIRITLLEASDREVDAKKLIIATGSKPSLPNIKGIDLPGVVTSDELLERKELYHKLLIIGGGVIGMEFASLYQKLGCEVEIIEAMDRILPTMDKEIAQCLAMSLKKKGVGIHTKSAVKEIVKAEDGALYCRYTEKEQEKVIQADGILAAVGRKASLEDLFPEELTPETDGPYLKVNAGFATSISGIYAIGDVVRGIALAHAASAQGIAAVEGMAGKPVSVSLSTIPSCVYTSPEIAVVGLNEEKAAEAGIEIKTGKYPMLGNGKTILSAGERGFIKLISEASTDRLIGAVLLCDRATDMVSELTTAIVHGLTIKELSAVVRPHPTYSEGITEALEDIHGHAVHLMPKY